ncbi:MAG: hypothetical protein KC543_11155 [Myxococcales bacterium]|nr:hypothetical protein [Myxococcales bacterium]
MAFAQPSSGFSLPPPPDAAPISLVGRLGLAVLLPVHEGPLCPARARCMLGRGLGIGGTLGWRHASGFGVGVGYDASVFDGNSVVEIAVLQTLRFSLRYDTLREAIGHPFLEVGAGPMLFGDSFLATTPGGMIDGQLGVEIELSPNVSATLSLGTRWFGTRRFTTHVDDVVRGAGHRLTGVVFVHAGLLLVSGRPPHVRRAERRARRHGRTSIP